MSTDSNQVDEFVILKLVDAAALGANPVVVRVIGVLHQSVTL